MVPPEVDNSAWRHLILTFHVRVEVPAQEGHACMTQQKVIGKGNDIETRQFVIQGVWSVR